jgi:hypothetical protein
MVASLPPVILHFRKEDVKQAFRSHSGTGKMPVATDTVQLPTRPFLPRVSEWSLLLVRFVLDRAHFPSILAERLESPVTRNVRAVQS